MPDRYHIHTAAMPARFPAPASSPMSIGARIAPAAPTASSPAACTTCTGTNRRSTATRWRLGRNPGRMQSLPLLRTGLYQGAAERLDQLRIPEHGRRVLRPAFSSPPGTRLTRARSRPGGGYRGRFHGPGFDSIWTDMLAIVLGHHRCEKRQLLGQRLHGIAGADHRQRLQLLSRRDARAATALPPPARLACRESPEAESRSAAMAGSTSARPGVNSRRSGSGPISTLVEMYSRPCMPSRVGRTISDMSVQIESKPGP